MINQAVILAGGKGTRLGKLTSETPKPLIHIGDKAIVEHQLQMLRQCGIERVLLTIGHLREKIEDLIGKGNRYGLEISFFIEDKPLGSAGAFPLFQNQLDEDFFVLYGDVMMAVDLSRLAHFHNSKKALATLVVHPNDHPYDSDLVECTSENLIKTFHPKPHDEGKYYKNLVNAGLYVLNRKLVDHIPLAGTPDFGKDVFPSLVHTNKLYAYNTSEYLKDMGTPDRLDKVIHDYFSGKIEQKKLTNKQKAIFLDRDGVLNEDRKLIHKLKDLVLYDFTPETIKKINNSAYLSIVVTNQSVVARNLCTIEELEEIHNKLESELGRAGAKLDAIYYCPYHPDKGYPEENPEYKKEHPWRKPNPGMLEEAARQFNIDLKGSFIIGDRESDILAGKNAGTQTIGVMTGNGLKDSTTDPDYVFETVLEAVNFIIEEPYKDIADQLRNDVEQSPETPFVVAIGGNARSGKSNFASFLKNYLEQCNINTLVVALDHWLLAYQERKEAHDVFERFQASKIESDLKKLMNNEEVQLTRYFKDPELNRHEISYLFNKEKVIIVEGIVALNLNFTIHQAHKRFFLNIDKETYSKRFKSLYSWKGYDQKEIESLLEKRIHDEFELINNSKNLAHTII